MKNIQYNPEIQLELPGMKTGFYVFMNKHSMNLPDMKELEADFDVFINKYSINLPDVKELDNEDEAGIKKFTEENQLSLAIWI